MTDFDIRTLDAGDVDAVDRLRKANSATLGFLSRETLLDYLEKGRALGAKCGDGSLAAYMLFANRRTDLRVTHLCVDQEIRGKGLARKLMERLATESRNQGLLSLGQTDQGGFVITFLGPVVSPPVQMSFVPDTDPRNDPIERRVTRRLAEALAAARKATDDTNGGNTIAFLASVNHGVSANLCEALATLTEALPALDISVVWARTWPRDEARTATRFATHDAPVLREAGRTFRSREPQPGVVLVGLVQRLTRDETDTDGTVTLRTSIVRTSIDGSNQSVVTVLPQSDYHRAIEAHKTRAPVVMRGDLDRSGQRWRLLNPSIEDVIVNDEAPSDADRRLDS